MSDLKETATPEKINFARLESEENENTYTV